ARGRRAHLSRRDLALHPGQPLRPPPPRPPVPLRGQPLPPGGGQVVVGQGRDSCRGPGARGGDLGETGLTPASPPLSTKSAWRGARLDAWIATSPSPSALDGEG